MIRKAEHFVQYRSCWGRLVYYYAFPWYLWWYRICKNKYWCSVGGILIFTL